MVIPWKAWEIIKKKNWESKLRSEEKRSKPWRAWNVIEEIENVIEEIENVIEELENLFGINWLISFRNWFY